MRCLIAGCGYVGSELAARLVAAGHTVFGLRRRPVGLPPGVVPVAADLCERAALAAALPRDLDAVVYAASADGRDVAAYRRAYLDGLANVLDALPRRGPRVLFTSSTSVYGQDDGSWVDEGSLAEPGSETAEILIEGEGVLAASGLRTTSVRFGGIYGPGRTRLLESVRRGEARIPAGPPVYTNRIHRDDAARALDHLLKLRVVDPVYVAVDDEPADLGTVLRWMAARLGVPEPPLAAGAGAAGRGRRSNKRCRNRRLRESGFAFRHPSFREGYDAILRDLEGAPPAG